MTPEIKACLENIALQMARCRKRRSSYPGMKEWEKKIEADVKAILAKEPQQ